MFIEPQMINARRDTAKNIVYNANNEKGSGAGC